MIDANLQEVIWRQLCDRFLPVELDDSNWLYSRVRDLLEPSQGWKFHISATIVEACDVFESVADILKRADVQYKAPCSLDVLNQINGGVRHGYEQVGKFITVYMESEEQARDLAPRLHEATTDFFPLEVPFDEQFVPNSNVFYRYGAFSRLEILDENGRERLAIRNQFGEMVPDDRKRSIPEWIQDIFPEKISSRPNYDGTPLDTKYRVFRAIRQRGKGGTYEALELHPERPRLCILKEGRRNGELWWNGQDGFALAKKEFENLKRLQEIVECTPRAFEAFEIHGNQYFSMERVEGKSLDKILSRRQRRLSINQILTIGIRIAEILETIHAAGWFWNDCKPANLILGVDGTIRPIDFENAHQAGEEAPFDWGSKGYSRPVNDISHAFSGRNADLFALGCTLYFLITGALYDHENPIAVRQKRSRVPQSLISLVERLTGDSRPAISQAKGELERILEVKSIPNKPGN